MIVALTINDFLDRAAAVYPDRIAIVDEPDQPATPLADISYRQLAAMVRRMGVAMDGLGLPMGARVAIVSPNAARFLAAYFGVCGNGRVLVPINFRLQRDEVAFIVEHSGAEALLLDPELVATLGDIPCRHVSVLGPESDPAWYDGDGEPRPWPADEQAIATIDYTSGTTARPKGVEQTHRARWINSVVFGWQSGVSDRDVYLHVLPMFHCDGWGMPFTMAAMGVKQVVLRKVDGAEILRRIRTHGVTICCGAPAVYATVLEAAAKWQGEIPGRNRMRILVAGAPPPSTIIERMEAQLGWEVIQLYGLTETAPLLTMSRRRAEWDPLTPAERAKRLARAGAPALGVRMAVSESGELLARSNHVLSNYWRNPTATAAAIQDGWFHTGDGGHVDDEGYYTITDRKKDVIITGGENVSSIEVEDALFKHPAVREAAVIGVPHDKWGETVKALVVVAAGRSVSEPELIEHCRARLAHYKCPTSIEFRTALERTATGKLQKYKLRAPYWAGRTRNVN
jgi:fatty-acyl-CoA synthase